MSMVKKWLNQFVPWNFEDKRHPYQVNEDHLTELGHSYWAVIAVKKTDNKRCLFSEVFTSSTTKDMFHCQQFAAPTSTLPRIWAAAGYSSSCYVVHSEEQEKSKENHSKKKKQLIALTYFNTINCLLLKCSLYTLIFKWE